MIIRPLQHADRTAIVDLYNHYVTHSPCTFDLEPFTVASRAAWFNQFDGQRYQCLVAEIEGAIIGYANSAQFRTKAAYASSVETSVYVRADTVHKRVGQALYGALFEALKPHDVHRAYAGITQPNPASERLHERFGFTPCGRFEQVGFKFEQYWDVAWFQRDCS